MRKVIASFIASLLLVPALAMAAPPPAPTATSELCKGSGGTLNAEGSCQPKEGKTLAGDDGYFDDIVNMLIFITGAVAVVVLIIGGLNYVTSTGDPARVKRAKDTILYAITGLIVAILAYAIINFVIGRL